jgi:hypothetical protein
MKVIKELLSEIPAKGYGYIMQVISSGIFLSLAFLKFNSSFLQPPAFTELAVKTGANVTGLL